MRLVSALLLLLLSLITTAPLRAADAIQVRSASVNVHGGVFALNVRSTFPADDQMRAALTDGATINFALRAVVDKQRRYWFDERLVDVTLQRELSWNALGERYVLKEAERGQQQTFASLEDALVAAGIVKDWMLTVAPQLDPDASYEISVRAGIRRGRMPEALRALTFWTRYWTRRSAWYTWLVPR